MAEDQHVSEDEVKPEDLPEVKAEDAPADTPFDEPVESEEVGA